MDRSFSFFNHYIDNEICVNLVMDHKYGIKWFRILASFHTNILVKLLNCPVDSKITPSTVVLRLSDRRY